MKKNIQSLFSIILYVFFAVYIALLLYLLFFARIGLRGMELYEINFIPFFTISEQLSQLQVTMTVANLLINIFLLVPLGLYLPVLWGKKKIIIYFCLIVIISLFVEVVQFIFDLGAADIDDIILNSFGGFLGLMSYKILFTLFKQEYKVRIFTAIISAITGILVIIFLAVELFQWITWNNSIL